MLLRHAEAGGAAVDADRRLTGRGASEAAAVGRWLAGIAVRPDRVVVSPARRARQTWDQAAPALGPVPPPEVDDRIYDNTPESVLAAIRATPADVTTLVVVGHNPSVGQLAHVLGLDPGDTGGRQRLGPGFPPGTAVVLELGGPFVAVSPAAATLTDVRVPGA